jgi:hypothetical protein
MDLLVSRLISAAKARIASWRYWFCIYGWLLLLLPGVAYSRSHRESVAPFSIDLDKPFPTVVEVVRDVAGNGVIQGTFEFKGDESLSRAEAAPTSRLFPPWTGSGQVFFKVRTRALSPAHFLNSNDMGTVAVRYVVQELGPNSTRLNIDAVFVENTHHRSHPSDGYVEASEFGVVGKRLRESDRQQHRVSSLGTDQHQESSSRAEKPAIEVVDSSITGNLQHVIAAQEAKLDAESETLRQLQARAAQLRQGPAVRISVLRAELKAFPYAHSPAVAALAKDEQVTILAKSAYWYRIRSADGQEGWIHHRMLESGP